MYNTILDIKICFLFSMGFECFKNGNQVIGVENIARIST